MSSLLDDLQQEVSKRNPLYEKRTQIEALRDQAQIAFKEQFLLSAADPEQIAFLKGRVAAFDECLDLFLTEEEQAHAQEQRKWEEDEA
jgi:hypothetical protein